MKTKENATLDEREEAAIDKAKGLIEVAETELAVRKSEPGAGTVYADPLTALLSNPEQLAQCPIETVERLFELQRQSRADQARIAYHEAFNEAQVELEPVRKAGWNESTSSAYGKGEDIEKMLQPIIFGHGFSYSASTETGAMQGMVTVKMTVRHVQGHEEQHRLEVPMDDVGLRGNPNKTKIQGMGSSYRYAVRYLLTYVWGIQLVPDSDGNKPKSTEPVTADELRDLQTLVSASGADAVKFCQYLGVPSLDKLPASRLKEAIRILGKKQRIKDKKEREQS